MADDSPEDTVASPDPGRVKRAPPTIDLEASEVSDRPQEPAGDAPPESKPWGSKPPEPDAQESEAQESKPEEPGFQRSESRERPAAISPWVIAPFSGVAAAALVIGVGWMLGWPAVQPPAPPRHRSARQRSMTSGRGSRASRPKSINRQLPIRPHARMAALEKSLHRCAMNSPHARSVGQARGSDQRPQVGAGRSSSGRRSVGDQRTSRSARRRASRAARG